MNPSIEPAVSPDPRLSRRTLLAAGLAGLTAGSLIQPVEAKAMSSSDVVKSIILAWRKLDVEAVLALVDDNIVWYSHAGGKAPFKGKEAMRKFIVALGSGIKENRWRVFAMAEQGDTVYCEGVDDFTLTDGKLIIVPYLGMMKVRNGLVVEWRDYFDGGLLAKMNKGEFDFANDPAVPLWNRPALF